MWKHNKTTLLVVILVLPIIFGAIPVRSQTPTPPDPIYVEDCTNGGDGSEGDPYCSIGTALDNASPGHRIEVAGGTYQENIEIDTPGVSLVADGDVTIEDLDSGWDYIAEDSPRVPVIDITQNADSTDSVGGVTVSGFKIRNYAAPPEENSYPYPVVRIAGDGSTVENMDIYTENEIGADLWPGEIRAVADNVTIQGNTISRDEADINGHSTIALGQSAGYDKVYDLSVGSVTIEDNTVTGGPISGDLTDGSTVEVTDNSVDGAETEGIWFWRVADTADVTLNGNTVQNHDDGGTGAKALKLVSKPNKINEQTATADMLDAIREDNPDVGSVYFEWAMVQDGESIQAAVDAAEPGDTVWVEAGTYSESPSIDVEGLTLEGPNAGIPVDSEGRGAEATIDLTDTEDPGSAIAETAVNIKASGVVLDGFEILGNQYAGTGISVNGNKVNWASENITDTGIEITNNDIKNFAGEAGGSKTQSFGILAWSTDDPIKDIIITGNNIDTIGSGAFDNNGTPNSQGFGIALEDLSDEEGAVIEDNTIQNIGGMTLNDNDYPGVGIAIQPKYNTGGSYDVTKFANADIRSNDVGSADIAVSVAGDVSDTTINNNHLAGNEVGVTTVRNPGAGGWAIYNLDSGESALEEGTGPVDATSNWWGSDAGPSGEGPGDGAAISANVKYGPWLKAPDGNLVSDSTQQLDFVQGWQMISTNVVPYDPSPSGVFDTHLGNVFAYDAKGKYGNEGGYVSGNDLSGVNVTVTEGYWVYTHNPNPGTDLEVEGFTPAENWEIEFTEGNETWYMFSVPFETPWSDVIFERAGNDEDLAPKVASSSDNDLIYGKVYTYNTEYDPDVSDSDPYIVAAETDREDTPVDVGILKANKAYWIRVDEADSGETPLTMTIPYQPADTPSTGESAMAAATVSKPVPEDAPQPPVPPMINQASGELEATAAVNNEAVSFEVAGKEVSSISVQVFDMDGQKVFSGTSAGNSLSWDADVPNGVYLYGTTAEVNGETKPLGIQKLLVLR